MNRKAPLKKMCTARNIMRGQFSKQFSSFSGFQGDSGRKAVRRGSTRKTITLENVCEILEKLKISRTKFEIKIASSYLANNYDYFKKIKQNEPLKLEKFVGVLNLETFKKGSSIITYGEEGDKFYIVLDGKVGVYKPRFEEKLMSMNEFYLYVVNVKYQENNMLKVNRVMERNAQHHIDLDTLSTMDAGSYIMRKQMNFYIEVNDLLGEFGKGFSFGEIALIKRCTRNATIAALEETKVLSIDKYDYNKIIRELEEKRLEKVLIGFKKTYPVFQYWTNNHLIKLLNCFSYQTLVQGDYLYKQNEDSEYIYFVKSGTLEMYSLVSFGWLSDFYSYIGNSTRNFVHLIDQRCIKNEADLSELYEETMQNPIPSPCRYDPLKIGQFCLSHEEKDTILTIKNEEEQLSDDYNLFKVNLKRIDYKDIVGLEDSIEAKKRYCFVKCVSSRAEIEKVKLYDFIKLIQLSPEPNNKKFLMDYIAEKKAWLVGLLKNSVSNRAKDFERQIDNKYKNLVKSKEKSPEEIKGTKLLVHKLRAWNSDLDELSGRTYQFNRSTRYKDELSFNDNEMFMKTRKKKPPKIFKKIALSPDFSSRIAQSLPITPKKKILSKDRYHHYSSTNCSGNNSCSYTRVTPEKQKLPSMSSRFSERRNEKPLNLKLKGKNVLNIPTIPSISTTEGNSFREKLKRNIMKKSFWFGCDFNKKMSGIFPKK